MKNLNTIIHGDCLSELKKLPDSFVDCCVTSPPYFGLRDYGVKGQLGLEKTPFEYVQNLVRIFKEVKRVLKENGTLWLVIGDTYAGGGNNRGNTKTISKMQSTNRGAVGQCETHSKNIHHISGIKNKDLIGIPWAVAFELRSDGWFLRQDIIWSKPNVMPESVRDRCTKSHEYIFLFSKSKRYYFDSDAIKEPAKPSSIQRIKNNWHGDNKRNFPRKSHNNWGEYFHHTVKPFRNKRSVWTVTTTAYRSLHFATFPTDLVTPCILAGSSREGIVLDPFFGSGTVGVVAKKLGRSFLGIEIKKQYVTLAKKRIKQTII